MDIKDQYCKSLGRKNYKKYVDKLRSEGDDVILFEDISHDNDPINIMLDGIVEQVLTCQEKLFEECDPNFLLGSAFVTFSTWQDAQKFEKYFGKSGKLYEITGCFPKVENKLTLNIGAKQYHLRIETAA